jgi:2-oxoglutarate dehydrogenase E1 component
MSKTMQDLQQDSYLGSGNEEYLENLYETYLTHPESVDPAWQDFFAKMAYATTEVEIPHTAVREQFANLAKHKQHKPKLTHKSELGGEQQEGVVEFIAAYRRLGHLQANIDPLGLYKSIDNPLLDPAHYGLSPHDNHTYRLGSFFGLPSQTATFSELYQALRKIYCGSIGFEYMHINRSEEIEWIQARIEKTQGRLQLNKTEKQRILDRLVVADGLEKYLGFKYVGQKRFSLEGGDSLIPMLDAIVNQSSAEGIKEIIIGMAHRGRLNVLINVVGKSPKEIFAAFEGKGISQTHSGDVKYHLGCSSDVKTKQGTLHLALAFNPSHLEIVSPVVQGSVRVRQRRRKDTPHQQVLPIQIHGDAAFAGQGVVMETFNMSQARWFTVGGSIHIVINNQVGFTTSNPQDARSTLYCTDVAKMIEAPILHVNANDPEAAYFAALFAVEYRNTFKRDVVIDLVCYRRHGHNEADEPSATQPVMYNVIKTMEVPYLTYAKKLEAEGVIEKESVQQWVDAYRKALDEGKMVVEVAQDQPSPTAASWEPFIGKHWTIPGKTAVSPEKIQSLAKAMEVLPPGFVVQLQVKKMLEARAKMTEGEMPINWGYAESMAFAALLDEGYPIRLCGQDAGRGTFAHRHAVLHDQKTDDIYIPLSHLKENQAQINIVDSFLSEEAVLAFEYGYATAEPNYLVIWEAQFGDFANGAQVVIDQFISSGEQKWGRLCGLVMLLPHGYEGQGPEHSSARLERYLQLCAQDNIQVCVPTTPAQIFHLLRRQLLRPYRKPLIIMSPKSVLRHPLAVSMLEELSTGEFQNLIPEIDKIDPKQVDGVVFCTGKVYYDLLDARRSKKIKNKAIIRIEQLYPFPDMLYHQILTEYAQAKDIVWCQEEPQNQGAWGYIQSDLLDGLKKGQVLRYAGRQASASPAAGYHAVHDKEQKELVEKALMT